MLVSWVLVGAAKGHWWRCDRKKPPAGNYTWPTCTSNYSLSVFKQVFQWNCFVNTEKCPAQICSYGQKGPIMLKGWVYCAFKLIQPWHPHIPSLNTTEHYYQTQCSNGATTLRGHSVNQYHRNIRWSVLYVDVVNQTPHSPRSICKTHRFHSIKLISTFHIYIHNSISYKAFSLPLGHYFL